MKKSQNLVIVTYNLQFALHRRQIKANIFEMAESGVVVFSFQEVAHNQSETFIIDELLTELGSDWQAICHLGPGKSVLDMGTCILWNTKVLTLKDQQLISLPKSKKLIVHEKIFTWLAGGVATPFPRRATIGYFEFDQTTIRITSLHLDHNGGLLNRQKQIQYLVEALDQRPVSHEIICGDFNSFDLLSNGHERAIHHQILGSHFQDASADSGWTADLHDTDIKHGAWLFKLLIKGLRLHIRKKIDYIWVKKMAVVECRKLPFSGSDHKPLVATLNVQTQNLRVV